VSNPGPRTRETMATRSRSTSSRLAFGNPKLRNMQRVDITDAVLNHSRGPKASCIRCGGICLQCRYRFQCCQKGHVVCRIIEPVSPGYSCRLKQKNKIAGRRCRIQSEMLPSETTPRAPSSPWPRRPFETWLASLKDRSANRFPGARKLERSEGSVPAPRVKQRKKRCRCALVPESPKHAGRPEEKPAKRRPRGHMCCLLKSFAMRASQRCVHS